ncbi:MAG: WHG domain-containing protein [Actinomycetota bacterium]|nr:WHG domain-containing protein [Actinomycetota bacterium]
MALEAARRLAPAIANAARDREDVDALRAIAHAYPAFALGHPALHAAMLPVPPLDDHEEAHAAFAVPVQVLAEVLGALGLSADDAVPVIRSLRSALHGFVSLEAGGGFGVPDNVDHSQGSGTVPRGGHGRGSGCRARHLARPSVSARPAPPTCWPWHCDGSRYRPMRTSWPPSCSSPNRPWTASPLITSTPLPRRSPLATSLNGTCATGTPRKRCTPS